MELRELEKKDLLYKVYFVQCISRGLPLDIAEDHALRACRLVSGELDGCLKSEIGNLSRYFLSE